jgi:hypothetical protein
MNGNGIKNTESKNVEKVEDVVYRLLYVVELCSVGAYRCLTIFLVIVQCLRQSV